MHAQVYGDILLILAFSSSARSSIDTGGHCRHHRTRYHIVLWTVFETIILTGSLTAYSFNFHSTFQFIHEVKLCDTTIPAKRDSSWPRSETGGERRPVPFNLSYVHDYTSNYIVRAVLTSVGTIFVIRVHR